MDEDNGEKCHENSVEEKGEKEERKRIRETIRKNKRRTAKAGKESRMIIIGKKVRRFNMKCHMQI